MAPTEAIKLSDYDTILVAYEQEFRTAKGLAHQEVVQEIIEEIITQSNGSLNKGAKKALVKVSWLFYICSPKT